MPISIRNCGLLLFTVITTACSSTEIASEQDMMSMPREQSSQNIVTFGLIADVHQDIMHDGLSRINAFVTSMNEKDADFICQLGDFCLPKKANLPFLNAYNSFKNDKYHVRGNHETDGGFKPKQVVDFFGMKDRYYSFDKKGIHFVVLDGNEPGGKAGGYKRFISQKQLDWLRDNLRSNKLPVVIFSHQSLVGGLENSEQVREILETREADEQGKVIAAFNGHHHVDTVVTINYIHYVMINSASYIWVGREYKAQSYSNEIHNKYKWLEATIPYRDPIWAFVSIDLDTRVISIKGKKSTYVGPGPKERKLPKYEMNKDIMHPEIVDRLLTF